MTFKEKMNTIENKKLLDAAAKYIERMELEHDLDEAVVAELVYLVDGLILHREEFIRRENGK